MTTKNLLDKLEFKPVGNYSKKELYKDLKEMYRMYRNAIDSNIELKIINDTMQQEVDAVNKVIAKFNEENSCKDCELEANRGCSACGNCVRMADLLFDDNYQPIQKDLNDVATTGST